MEKLLQVLSLFLCVVAGTCLIIWAGYINDGIDFIGIAHHAHKFPMGPDVGPIAFTFGFLLVAWLIYPTGDSRRRDDRRH